MKTDTFFKYLIAIFMFVCPSVFTYGSSDVDSNIPRAEYPRPQFVRDQWINLNGEWNFQIDYGKSGLEQEWQKKLSVFNKKITVPFCPESKLSGVKHLDFMPAVWYHKSFRLPDNWKNQKVFINFGAVDYDSQVWVNNIFIGRHVGGSASFSYDISQALKEGKNDVVVYAADDIRSGNQPYGKQSNQYYPYSCFYTRTTGIWQTVWLEACPKEYIESVKVIPDIDNEKFVFIPKISANRTGNKFRVTVTTPKGKKIKSEYKVLNGLPLEVNVPKPRLWSPEDPFLYQLKYELIKDNQVVDVVSSYAGMRKIHIEGNKIYLNNKPIFLKLVLDQGFYPDGIWTAPSDEKLKNDIQLAMDAGFNGARLHQKVFEERYHYWADKLGYLTWGEFNDWEIQAVNHEGMSNLKREWYEVVQRDLNHPSIITWTPYNERADQNVAVNRVVVKETVDLTHSLDPTRPVNDASGYSHVKTDIFTVHDYDQNPQTFYERYDSLSAEKKTAFICFPELSEPYKGQPYIVDEYGGTHWSKEFAQQKRMDSDKVWEWGKGKSATEIEDLIEKLTQVLLNNPNVSGFCFTQLTDVEQEINGIYTYDRQPKFNIKRLKSIFSAKAAIEK